MNAEPVQVGGQYVVDFPLLAWSPSSVGDFSIPARLDFKHSHSFGNSLSCGKVEKIH
jgi:hypothetical protein